MTPDFALHGLEVEYRHGVASLHGIDLTIARGERLAVVGANGSGKSTLLKVLDGLVFPTAGAVSAFGRPLTEDSLAEPEFRRQFRGSVGFVFQDADVQLFCANVATELAFGPLQLGLDPAQVRRRVADIAAQLRLEPLLDRAPYTLSGGEKKRVAIASVLTMEPRVVLLDEPTNALDPRSQAWLLDLLHSWREAGRTVVIATHDLSLAEEFADRVVVLSEAHEVAAAGPPAQILTDRELLLTVNLIHVHAHRHGRLLHGHAHAHGEHRHADG